MYVIVAGSSGLIGSVLTIYLRRRGHQVVTLVRRPVSALYELSWDPDRGQLPQEALTKADAVVNLCGAGIAAKRWTNEYRREILDSRIRPTNLLAHAIAQAGRPIRLLNASAVGIYGNRDDTPLSEASPAGTGFLADVVASWEAATAPASRVNQSVALLRTGIVLSPDGGALAKMLPLAKLGLGGPIGSGRQYWPLITLTDHVRATEFLLEHPEIQGAVNLATITVPQRQFASELGRQLHRPAFLPTPGFVLRLLVGGFASDLVASQRVTPEVLSSAGFQPQCSSLPGIVAWALGKSSTAE